MEGNEITKKDIIGWIVVLLASLGPQLFFYFVEYKDNKEKSKKHNENQNKKMGEIEKKAFQEQEARVRLEKDFKLLNALYSEIEKDKAWYKENNKLLKERVYKLRKQMIKKGIPPEEHDIGNEERREEEVLIVKMHWEENQNKSGKINRKTITEILGENWENNFKNKEGEDIIKERNWLIKKIDDEIKSTKQ